jgi:hypothetical protein
MYGMSYEQFWEGDPWMVKDYAEKHLLERKMKNEEMWIHGAYMLEAVSVALANGFSKRREKYLEKPFEIFAKTEVEKELERIEARRKLVEHLDMIMRNFNQKHSKGVDQDGSHT